MVADQCSLSKQVHGDFLIVQQNLVAIFAAESTGHVTKLHKRRFGQHVTHSCIMCLGDESRGLQLDHVSECSTLLITTMRYYRSAWHLRSNRALASNPRYNVALHTWLKALAYISIKIWGRVVLIRSISICRAFVFKDDACYLLKSWG